MSRITINEKHEPSIRDLTVNVGDVLRCLGSGMSQEEIMKDHPGLVREDFLAVYQYAAKLIEQANVIAGLPPIGEFKEQMERIRRDVREKLGSVDDHPISIGKEPSVQ